VKSIRILMAWFLMCCPGLAQSSAPAAAVSNKPAHDREFWRAIAKNHYAVPEGHQVFPLLRDLSGYVGSRDPELRDDLGYSITTAWIKHQKQISVDELNSLLDEWEANLRVGIGEESKNDSVLKRSFSALSLVALAERDLEMPFLSEERYRTFLSDALAYLKDERDLRGFDPTIGWIHATAHTADLLAALARNSLFKREDQSHLLDAIARRLSSAHEIFRFGEQDRLALAIARVVLRKDFDASAFHGWLSTLDASDQLTWKDSPPKLEQLQTFENDTYMLWGLAGYFSMSPSTAAVTDAQNEVLKVLRER
jgi:Protein of unknown function (DUF2785)